VWFILLNATSRRLLDVREIQRHSSGVVLYPKADTYFADHQHVCEFIEQNVHVRVQVKPGHFLQQFSQDYSFMSLYKILSVSFELWI
jgi:hypothetical protein